MTTPTMTFCYDARCVSSQRCQRAEHERYGNAPGESYGPRCVPVPYGPAYQQGIADGEKRERAAVVAWLRAEADAPHPIEVGEHALSPSGRGLLLLAASYIERGAHRREEGR